MADILETAMLVCFGISWPIALIKSIKVVLPTTSVQFIISSCRYFAVSCKDF
jgi:hypothetical protein